MDLDQLIARLQAKRALLGGATMVEVAYDAETEGAPFGVFQHTDEATGITTVTIDMTALNDDVV